MKKIFSLIMALGLAAWPYAALAEGGITLDESVTLDSADMPSVEIPLDAAPALSDIAAANTLSSIISRNESVASYTLDYTYIDGQTVEREASVAFVNSGSGITLYETNDALSFVYDGSARYIIYPDGRMGVNICFDDYLSEYYKAYMASFALYRNYDGEVMESCRQQGGRYIITTRIAHGAYADATGRSFDMDDAVPLINTITVDADTLEVLAWDMRADVAEGIALELFKGSATYGNAELPPEYFAMSEAEVMRSVSIVTVPLAGSPTRADFSIASGARPYVMVPDGYMLAESANGRYIEADVDSLPAEGDITLYLVEEAE